jgi:hypothetical protein
MLGNYNRKVPLIHRIGQPQFLSQERYDKSVRAVLLEHAIETRIARKFEGMIDVGVQSRALLLIIGMGNLLIPISVL